MLMQQTMVALADLLVLPKINKQLVQTAILFLCYSTLTVQSPVIRLDYHKIKGNPIANNYLIA